MGSSLARNLASPRPANYMSNPELKIEFAEVQAQKIGFLNGLAGK
jgi:hypothetical protein